eukprot:CAMPEP_0194712190 /NCGR_PEP_ID=MMETSP0296-20130528/4371_1 /TAXON_ID=39354 /ORGANISM="Heterosigma akashiwo, Strain CCMP2393" /LENGTH=602 /DNA_ID=CAMNT_0039610541 /DNA_START=147 /DNA_END=1955 /DNA_ORIENTATION=-
MPPSPGIARNPFCLFSSADSTADLEAAIQAKGDEIRAEKAAGKTNADVADLVAELKSLKAQLEAASGGPKEPLAAPAAEKKDKKKKEKKPPKAQQVEVDVAATLARVPFAEADAAEQKVGDYALIQSHPPTGRVYAELAGLGKEGGPQVGDAVWVRARVAAVRAKGGSCFLVLRQGAFETAQALHFKDKSDPEGSKLLIKFAGQIPLESIVDVKGTLAAAEVKSCSVSDVEIQIERLYVASRALPVLPFLLEDAARSEGEIEASQATERPFARVGQETRLDNRWLDLRVPANNAVMRVQSMVCQLFREALYAEGFCEIHSPKLIGGESEGGAGVFKTQYFDQVACLAQSPQLYKQMAISADLGRVFEIGPVFRAENSNTRRHLCEFTGLDLEMAITEHYNEVLVVMHRLFRHIFDGLEQRLPKELAAIREQYHSEPVTFTEEPCIIHWEEGIAMLRGAGVPDVGDFDDLNGAQELELGRLVKEKYGTDFFMLDRFPSAIRPFYTMPCPDDDRYSNSYDLFIRGQEICSGAQRVHDPDLLEAGIRRQGIDPAPLGPYLDAFRHGCSPHGGAGVGLERVVFLYLGLDNVRKASMFPRDPNRCSP